MSVYAMHGFFWRFLCSLFRVICARWFCSKELVVTYVLCVCRFSLFFKSIKRSMHNVGCIGCVTISTRTGVYEFRSVTYIKGNVFLLQTTHILFCQRAWYFCVRLSLLWASTTFVCGKSNFSLLFSKLPKVYAFK